MAEELGETLGSVAIEIRDILEALQLLTNVVARPKATDWDYGNATTTLIGMSDVVVVTPKTGFTLNPTCVIVRCAKASNIDVCLTPYSPRKSEIVAPGNAPDNGLFIHWFPFGINTVGTSEGDNKFWIRAQGIAEAGLVEGVAFYEETR